MKQKIIDFYTNHKKLTLIIITLLILLIAFWKPIGNLLLKELNFRGDNVGSGNYYISEGSGDSGNETNCENLYSGTEYKFSIDNTYTLSMFIECSEFDNSGGLNRRGDFKSIVTMFLEEDIGIDVLLLTKQDVLEEQENSIEPIVQIGRFDDKYIYAYGYTNLDDSEKVCTNESVRLYDQSEDNKYIKAIEEEKPFLSKFGGICAILSSAYSYKFSLGFNTVPEGWPQETYTYKLPEEYKEKAYLRWKNAFPDADEKKHREFAENEYNLVNIRYEKKTYFNPDYLEKIAKNVEQEVGVAANDFGALHLHYEKYPNLDKRVNKFFYTNMVDKNRSEIFVKMMLSHGYTQVNKYADIMKISNNKPNVDCNLYTHRHLSNIKSISLDSIEIYDTLTQGDFRQKNDLSALIPADGEVTKFRIGEVGYVSRYGMEYESGVNGSYWKSRENDEREIDYSIFCYELSQ